MSRPHEQARRPGRPLRANTSRAILDAATRLLAEGGYGRLTIDGVALRAGVARASIVRRWPSKVTLVMELLAELGDAIPTPNSGEIMTDLLLFFQSHIDGVPTPLGRIVPSLLAESFNDAELAEAMHDVYVLARRKRAMAIFERAVERGELRKGIDSGVAVDIISGLVSHRQFVSGLEFDLTIARRFIDILLGGIGLREPPLQ